MLVILLIVLRNSFRPDSDTQNLRLLSPRLQQNCGYVGVNLQYSGIRIGEGVEMDGEEMVLRWMDKRWC